MFHITPCRDARGYYFYARYTPCQFAIYAFSPITPVDGAAIAAATLLSAALLILLLLMVMMPRHAATLRHYATICSLLC